MHECTICHNQFSPRPQVKTPKACANPSCQKTRQKLNEKSWRERNQGLYDGLYHRTKRSVRLKKLSRFSDQLSKCLQMGIAMLGLAIDFKLMESFFQRFLAGLGIRLANKLWMS